MWDAFREERGYAEKPVIEGGADVIAAQRAVYERMAADKRRQPYPEDYRPQSGALHIPMRPELELQRLRSIKT
jgi:hypothetical protein